MNILKSLVFIQCVIMSFFLMGTTLTEAGASGVKYALVYDQLYPYGENNSQVLELYLKLKSEGNSVLLLQAEKMQTEEIEKDRSVVVIPSSFDSRQEYINTVAYFKNKDYNMGFVSSDKTRLLIGVDKIYPFSDLKKLMDLAEDLHDRGIQFVCDIMPVYENYEFEAFDKYIEVLKYVQKMGGEFFINYPVINADGTYNMDTRPGLEKAVTEYRNRGLRINGIVLPSDALLMDTEAYQNLDLPFLLIEENEEKIDTELDLWKISKELDNNVFFYGISDEDFDFFQYKTLGDQAKPDLMSFSLDDDISAVNDFLTSLRAEKINIIDFEPDEYDIQIIEYNAEIDDDKINDGEKNELDQFKEEELKKIKGENLEPEQAPKGYDISKFGSISVKVAGVILLLLAIQVFIGRRFDYRKFFKN